MNNCEKCGTALFPEYAVSQPQEHVLRVEPAEGIPHDPNAVVKVSIHIKDGIHTEAFVSSLEHFEAFIHHAKHAVASELARRIHK